MRSRRASYLAIPLLLLTTWLVPASANAKRMTLGTALRYAATAPLQIGGDAVQLTVSGCRRRGPLAFTCDVDVNYPPPPPIKTPNGTARTSAPVEHCTVRVSYRTRHSTTPVAKTVGACHVTG